MKIERKKVDKIKISHNKPLFLIIILLIIVLVVLIYFILKNKAEIPIEKECSVDNDCAADCGCHVEKCVPLVKRGECDAVFCSQVCSGPLDCGAGHCGCVNNKCQIVKN